MAVSSFEWVPAVPVYHSRDLKHWRLLTHCIGGGDEDVIGDATAAADLRRLPSAKGVWAPCLTWCEQDHLFYLVYSIMNSTNARFFDVDNFLITAEDIHGPWSQPVYLHSAGFDGSLFHDGDGRKWLVSLEWEIREGYHKPGEICIVEYDVKKKRIIGLPQRIWRGATKRGCIEGPHIYKKAGYYYLICAEGGTGYGHCATSARAKNILGPYEPDPKGPILTSTPDFDEMDNDDYLKPHRYNPDLPLQKSGHASIVETSSGEVYLAHQCGRPFLPELRCTLGRETCLQKMVWTEDGWLRMAGGGNLAREFAEESKLPAYVFLQQQEAEVFDGRLLHLGWYAPRIAPDRFTALTGGALWLRGQESLSSVNRVSLLVRKLTSVFCEIETEIQFEPIVYQHYAGLALYYDNMNYTALRICLGSDGPALGILRVENGKKTEESGANVPYVLSGIPVRLKLTISGRDYHFSWSSGCGDDYNTVGGEYDTSLLSDEYSQTGEFTGTMAGIFCVDSMTHSQSARFSWFAMRILY